jgi:hypothetical protein
MVQLIYLINFPYEKFDLLSVSFYHPLITVTKFVLVNILVMGNIARTRCRALQILDSCIGNPEPLLQQTSRTCNVPLITLQLYSRIEFIFCKYPTL